jgi:hypothetical protein
MAMFKSNNFSARIRQNLSGIAGAALSQCVC